MLQRPKGNMESRKSRQWIEKEFCSSREPEPIGRIKAWVMCGLRSLHPFHSPDDGSVPASIFSSFLFYCLKLETSTPLWPNKMNFEIHAEVVVVPISAWMLSLEDLKWPEFVCIFVNVSPLLFLGMCVLLNCSYNGCNRGTLNIFIAPFCSAK